MQNIALQSLDSWNLKPGNHIYVIWQEIYGSRSVCIYVGQTIRGVSQRIKEHKEGMSLVGQWLAGQNLDRISISIYQPNECMIAIEQQYGCGYNPQNIGLEWAERAMIAMLNPILNIQRPVPQR